jgi:hypothetical protein
LEHEEHEEFQRDATISPFTCPVTTMSGDFAWSSMFFFVFLRAVRGELVFSGSTVLVRLLLPYRHLDAR